MSLSARYGDPDAVAVALTDTLTLQLSHRSVRKFGTGDVSDAQLAALVAAAQSAATSSNLQAWSVIAVRDADHKARLAALAANQQFINDAPLFLVWVVDLGRARRLAQHAGAPLDGADYLESTIIGFVDTALAAQNAVVAAESLGLGTVFVGAVRNHPDQVAQELDLPPHTVAAFGLAVGVPDPTERAGIKPRLHQNAVLHRERYEPAVADAFVAEYDVRITDYNVRHGLPDNWTTRVLARLAGPQSLSGRHVLRDHLERRGLPSR